jgi:hypothetical protein
MFRFNGSTYVQQYRRCGKKNCHICKDGHGHGPYWYERSAKLRYIGKELPESVENARQQHANAQLLLRQLEDRTCSLRKLIRGERLNGHDLDVLANEGIKLLVEVPPPEPHEAVLRRLNNLHTAADEQVIKGDENAQFALGGLVEGMPRRPPPWLSVSESCVPAAPAPAQDPTVNQ